MYIHLLGNVMLLVPGLACACLRFVGERHVVGAGACLRLLAICWGTSGCWCRGLLALACDLLGNDMLLCPPPGGVRGTAFRSGGQPCFDTITLITRPSHRWDYWKILAFKFVSILINDSVFIWHFLVPTRVSALWRSQRY